MSYRIVDKKQKQHMEPGPTRRKLRITRPAQRKAQISQQQLTTALKKAERSALQAVRRNPKPRRKFIRRELDQQIPVNVSRVAVGRSQAKIYTKGNVQVVSHSEYTYTFTLTTGANGGDFSIFSETSTYGPTDVNPGFPAFLPWASNIAKDYERYKFNKLNFRFVPKQPTTSSGMLMLMYDYDFCDAPPTTKVEFLQNASSLEASTFTPVTLVVNPRLLAEGTLTGGWRYVSNGASSTSTESRETMAGYLVVAVDGLSPNTTYSWDMWVEYEMLLKVPRPPNEVDESVSIIPPSGHNTTIQSAGVGGGMILSNQTYNNFTTVPISGLSSIINNSSAPSTAGVSGSRNSLFFRLMRQLAGIVKFDIDWASTECNGGVNGPSDKGTVNQWYLNARDAAGNLITSAWRPLVDRTEGGAGYSYARIKRGSNHNPLADDLSLGMTVEFAIGPKVFSAISAAGKKITEVWWELASNAAVVMLTSLPTTALVISFLPYYSGQHRVASLSLSAPILSPSLESDDEEEEEAPQVTPPKKKK